MEGNVVTTDHYSHRYGGHIDALKKGVLDNLVRIVTSDSELKSQAEPLEASIRAAFDDVFDNPTENERYMELIAQKDVNADIGRDDAGMAGTTTGLSLGMRDISPYSSGAYTGQMSRDQEGS